MSWLSLIVFLLITLMTGALIDCVVKPWQADWLEKLIMRLGVGLAAMSVLGALLNLFLIPLDFRIYLAVGACISLMALFRNRQTFLLPRLESGRSQSPVWANKSLWYSLIILVLFGVTIQMYLAGAFRYDYLEDTDPWGYTVVAKFIADQLTFSVPHYSTQYSEPYTQGYQIIMGVLGQTNGSIYWTMKFFTALIVSFGVPFMYYFARQLTKDEDIALLSGVFLFAVPAWVTHFVYSFHVNLIVFVVLLYVLAQMTNEPDVDTESEKMPEAPEQTRFSATQQPLNWSWVPVGAIVYASLLINHFVSALHGTLLCLVFLVTKILAERRIDWRTAGVLIGGFLLSLIFYVPAYLRHWWVVETDNQIGGVVVLFPLLQFIVTPMGMLTLAILTLVVVMLFLQRRFWQSPFETWLSAGNHGLYLWLLGLMAVLIVLVQPFYVNRISGTGDRIYVWKDFFAADAANLITNPTGLGPVIMSFVVVAFVLMSAQLRNFFNPSRSWSAIMYAWVISAFLLVLGAYFNIALMPFRVWTFLGFLSCVFAAWGAMTLFRIFSRNRVMLFVCIWILIAITIPTTFVPKYTLNAINIWIDDTIKVPGSRELFTWMREGGLPKGSVVAHLCGDSEFLGGYDMNPPLWDEVFYPKRGIGRPYFMEHPLEITPQAYQVLKQAEVDYVTIGASCLSMDLSARTQTPSYRSMLSDQMDGLLRDRRLSLIKDNGYEMLFRLN